MNDAFLTLQMKLLIARYGYRHVVETLAGAHECSLEEVDAMLSRLQDRRRKRRTKPPDSYGEILQEITRSRPETRELIEKLGALYQSRTFLPELRHVNHFLERHGVSRRHSSRREALRAVIQVLGSLDEHELRDLLESTLEVGTSGEFAALANQIMAVPHRTER